MAPVQDQVVARPNVKPKHDNVDWAALEAFPGPFYLQFRVPVDEARETGRLVRYSVFVLLVVQGLSLLPLSVFYVLCSPEIGGGILLIGLTFMVIDFLRSEESERLVLMGRSFLKIVIPFGLWVGLLCIHMVRDRVPSGAIVLVGIGFFFIVLADRIAKHAIWQITAHPRLSIQTMTKWRRALESLGGYFSPVSVPMLRTDPSDAEHRKHDLVLDAIRDRLLFVTAFAYAIAVVAIPAGALLIFGVFSPVQLASWGGVLLIPSFIVTAWLVDRGNFKRNVRQTWAAVLSYFGHLRDVRVPGWCAISPVGSQRWRQALLLVGVGLVGGSLAISADYFMILSVVPGPWAKNASQVPGLSAAQANELLATRGGCATLMWLGIVDGQPFFILSLLISILLCVAAPLVSLFFALVIVIGPLLGALHDALENPQTAHEQEHKVWSDWDGYGHRLRASPNIWERRSLLLGVDTRFGFPLLLDYDLLFEHIQVVGSTGSGKTQLSLLNLYIQLVRRRKTSSGAHECMIAIFDAKFDPVLFLAAYELARQEGRTFKWFCPFPLPALPRTFAYNPLRRCAGKSLEILSAFILNSINAYSGPDYARQHYYYAAKHILDRMLKETAARQLQSFRALYALLCEMFQGNRGRDRDGDDILHIIEALSHFDACNVTPSTHKGHPALDHEIDFLDAIQKRQVIYCVLPASGDFASAGMFYRMAHFDLREACREYSSKHGRPAEVVTLNDEANVLFGGNLVSITQGRAFGLSLAFFYQDESQAMIPGGIDLTPILANNTVVKICHTVRDPQQKLRLAQNSGTAAYADFAYAVSIDDISAGRLSAEYATIGGKGDIGVRERLGPRVEIEDIEDVNRDIHKALARIDRNQGLSHFLGTSVIHIPWQMAETEFQRRSKETMSPEADGAISHDMLKEAETETVAPADPSQKANLEDKLRQLQDKLGGGKP